VDSAQLPKHTALSLRFLGVSQRRFFSQSRFDLFRNIRADRVAVQMPLSDQRRALFLARRH
jgi:hypothetical protein